MAHIHEIISEFGERSKGILNALPVIGKWGVFQPSQCMISENPSIQRSQCTDIYRSLVSPLPIALNQAAWCFSCYCEKRQLWEQELCAQFCSTGIFLLLVSGPIPLLLPFLMTLECNRRKMAILFI